jgi:hypothetical protein
VPGLCNSVCVASHSLSFNGSQIDNLVIQTPFAQEKRFMHIKDSLEKPPLHQQQMEALLEEFNQAKTEVILPVLEQARQILVAGNHGAMIQEREDGTLVNFVFCSEPALDREIEESPNSNCISFLLDTASLQLRIESRYMREASDTPIYSGHSVKPRVLTKEVVEGYVLAAIRAVFG